MISNLTTIIFLLLGYILFFKVRKLKHKKSQNTKKLSIIIPARNEEINLPILLSGLQNEKDLIYEIIVVDDFSSDKTPDIARSFGAKVINIKQHPSGWKGKNFACFTGSKEASGEILLFLDADLIPQQGMIKKLQSNYISSTVLSVQPYHYTKKYYEQISLFFNITAIGAVGVSLPGKDKSVGLFGPVLMMDKDLYFSFGGHEIVKNEVMEDYQLGTILRKRNIKCDMFLGYQSISYQMYKGGIFDLIWGWSKNFASGATNTPFVYLLPVVLWLMSYYSIAINLIKNIILYFNSLGSIDTIIFCLILYIFAATLLFLKARKLGNFSLLSCIFYIIPLAAFTLIFIFSLILKFIFKKVKWKGRWHKI